MNQESDINKGNQNETITKNRFDSATSKGQNSHKLKVLYCGSWGYEGAYQQLSQALKRVNPDLTIEGGIYPVPPEKKKKVIYFRIIQFAFIFMLFAGDWILHQLEITPPQIYKQIMGNKVVLFMIVFVVGNNLLSAMTTTGAFEVYLDGNKIFSKLDKGRAPQPTEILDAINAKKD